MPSEHFVPSAPRPPGHFSLLGPFLGALMKRLVAVAASLVAFSANAAPPSDSPEGEQRFRQLYKELVETNTALSAGSCTLAAERMAARLKAAGFPDNDVHLFTAPGHPK